MPLARPRAIALTTAFACLTLVLVLARVANVHLGADAAGIAVPLAVCGFAIGILDLHLRPAALERFVLGRSLVVLAASCVAALLIAFALFCWVMPPTSTSVNTKVIDETLKKVAVFVVLVGVPCAQTSRILAALHQLHAETIASVHAAGLLGAALACVLTPVVFHVGGLSSVVIMVVALSFAPLVLERRSVRARVIVMSIMLLVGVGSERLVDHADRSMSYENWGMLSSYREYDRVWNEHARVALVELDRSDRGEDPLHRVILDNARTNVHINRYYDRGRNPKQLTAISAPWILGRNPRTVLVLGAGAGDHMTFIDQHAFRHANITGVELDRDIPRLAQAADSLADYGLARFFGEDRIEFRHEEPRRFLASLPEDVRFDFIYIGVDAQTEPYTRHSPAYLHTVEGYRALLDRLAPGGLLTLDHQPLDARIPNLRRVFAERGIDDVRDRLVVVNDARAAEDDLIVAPDGLREAELQKLVDAVQLTRPKYRQRLWYLDIDQDSSSIRWPTKERKYVELVEGELGETFDDDRPFVDEIDFEAWEPSPPTTDEASMESISAYVSWTKITAVVLVSSIALLIVVLSAIRRESRAPLPVLVLVLLTGACFMLCEVAIVARLGLFASQPLGMAVVPALLLLGGAVGSAWHARIGARCDVRVLASLAGLAAVVLALALDWIASALLGQPLVVVLALAALTVAPLGVVLGLLYPHVISCLAARERSRAIAICLGLSVLAGVVGLVHARVVLIELGASALLYLAAAGYLLALVVALVDRHVGGRWLSRAG
jgi:spermidine synthase